MDVSFNCFFVSPYCIYEIPSGPEMSVSILVLEICWEIRADIGVIIRKLCQQKGVEIIEANACPDHIHMQILHGIDTANWYVLNY